MITVNANDLNIENLPVKLHIKIETVGITIENPPTINTTPIFINGGETNVLFGEDLEDYFNINNLIFKGYSKNTYKRTGQLPEGFYKFSIDILHYNTNRPISNIGTVTAWIALGKPPVLKLPLNNAKMGQYKGVPLSFSWLPAAVGSPVSANSIQYKFEMWEMHIPAINPNTIAATTPLFHEHTDFNTIYTLYPSTLLMTPGMKYAWRITASDISGFVPFEQNGHSEIRTFIYKAACDSVTNLTAKNRGKSALFKWESKSNHTSFNIEMQNPQTGWVNNSESFQSKAEFFDLNYGDTYKMRVQAVCDGDPDSKSDFSDWKTVTIPKPAPATDDCPECVCDDKIPDAEITNFDLRDDLQPGDTIINKTGTSRYIVKSVEPQGDGAYKGVFLFWTEIWNLKFICNYWDLQVNTDNVIVNMDFESVYDPKFLVDIDAATGYLDSLSNNISTLITDLTPKDTVNTDDSIISIYVNDGDSLIVVTVDDDGNTNEIVLSGDADDAGGTLITDDDGNEYIINNDGKPMGTGEYLNTGGGNQDKIDNYNKDKEENHLSESVTINFTQADKQKYGFDSYNNQKSALQTKYPTLKNGYRAAFKSIASFGSDIVGISSKHSNVVYKDEMGIPCTKTGENLNIRGSTNGSDVTLYAYHTVNDTTEKVAGKLNILSFDEQAKQLYIVPVNGANVPDAKALKDVINSTYKQAITRWEVTKIDNLSDVTFKSGNMSHGGTSAISVYNKDQRTIVKRFKEVHGKLEKDAYYLFFVEGVQFKGRSIAGYMPLQRQVGFIYDNPNLNIIAHELGHGAFNLRHTFSSDNFIASEMSTQNLMDYKGGVELWKHQWKLIQSPDKLLFSWAQDEQEGEFVFGEKSFSNVLRAIRSVRCAKNRNKTHASLYFNTYSITVKIGSLVSALNWAGSDVSEEEIEFYISNDNEINLDYFEDRFDIKNIEYNDEKKQLVIKGSKRNLYIRSKNQYNTKRSDIYNFIKSLFDTNISIKRPNKLEINSLTAEQLSYLSLCDLTLLDDEKRNSIIRSISKESIISAKDEKLVINLIKTVENRSVLYRLFKNDKVSMNLYKGLNTYREEFVFLYNWVCEYGWTSEEITNAELVFLGTNDKGAKYQLSEVSWMFDDTEEDKIPVWNLEEYGGSNNYSKKFNSSPHTPIKIINFDGSKQTASTVLVDHIRAQENIKEWTSAFFDYLNGVGLSSAARILTTKSAPFIIRFIAVIEFGKTNIDIALNDNSVKQALKNNGHDWFVNNWHKISTAIDIATFGSEAIINFAKKGKDVSKVLRSKGKTKAAAEVDAITDEAESLIEYANDVRGYLTKADILISKLDDNLRNFANNFRQIGKTDVLSDGTTIVLKTNSGKEVGRIINNRLKTTKSQILEIEKKYRPDPKLYLDKSFIAKHLKRFEDEGGSFIIRERDITGYESMVDRKFVALDSEMDKVITKFNSANKDINILINDLDLGSSYYKKGDRIYLVYVDPKKGFKFELPNGNEIGAYDGEWVPGGYTKSGTMEAVISNSSSFKHHMDVADFKNNFGTNNVKLIFE
jgi:hypothetical protein